MFLLADHDSETLVHVQQPENTKQQQEIGGYTQKIYIIIVYQGDCRSWNVYNFHAIYIFAVKVLIMHLVQCIIAKIA